MCLYLERTTRGKHSESRARQDESNSLLVIVIEILVPQHRLCRRQPEVFINCTSSAVPKWNVLRQKMVFVSYRFSNKVFIFVSQKSVDSIINVLVAGGNRIQFYFFFSCSNMYTYSVLAYLNTA